MIIKQWFGHNFYEKKAVLLKTIFSGLVAIIAYGQSQKTQFTLAWAFHSKKINSRLLQYQVKSQRITAWIVPWEGYLVKETSSLTLIK